MAADCDIVDQQPKSWTCQFSEHQTRAEEHEQRAYGRFEDAAEPLVYLTGRAFHKQPCKES
jgi:hypothetical protein